MIFLPSNYMLGNLFFLVSTMCRRSHQGLEITAKMIGRNLVRRSCCRNFLDGQILFSLAFDISFASHSIPSFDTNCWRLKDACINTLKQLQGGCNRVWWQQGVLDGLGLLWVADFFLQRNKELALQFPIAPLPIQMRILFFQGVLEAFLLLETRLAKQQPIAWKRESPRGLGLSHAKGRNMHEKKRKEGVHGTQA